jgi:hypothetical protein
MIAKSRLQPLGRGLGPRASVTHANKELELGPQPTLGTEFRALSAFGRRVEIALHSASAAWTDMRNAVLINAPFHRIRIAMVFYFEALLT